MSTRLTGKTTDYVVDWCSTRTAIARRELQGVAATALSIVGMSPDPAHLTAFHEEMLELRAAVEALSNAADDLERGAATLREEGQS